MSACYSSMDITCNTGPDTYKADNIPFFNTASTRCSHAIVLPESAFLTAPPTPRGKTVQSEILEKAAFPASQPVGRIIEDSIKQGPA